MTMTTDTLEEIHDTFLFALSRHSLAARIEQKERALQRAWEEEMERREAAEYELELQRELEREAWEEYERKVERGEIKPYDYEYPHEDPDSSSEPWYDDPDLIGWEADEPEVLLPCEVRLNSR